MDSPREPVLGLDPGFDPDETLPLPDDSSENLAESIGESNGEACHVQQLMSLLNDGNSNGKVDEASSASLLSHLTSLKQGGWNDDSYELAMRAFRIAMQSMDPDNGGGRHSMDPIIAKRMLTDGILPLASASPPRTQNGQADVDQNSDAVWIAKLVRSVVYELLPTAFRIKDCAEENEQQNVNDGIKLLLPTFLHRMDTDEACQILSSQDDESQQRPQDTVDRILDQFCGLDNQCKPYPHATAGLILALREFDSFSGGRLSRRRVWQTRRNNHASASSHCREDTLEYFDRPTAIVRMAIESLHQLSTGANDLDALPPLVYQLGLLPMKLLQAGASDAKAVKGRGENEKQRGMRLRRLVLDGIAEALDDGSLGRVDIPNAACGVLVQTSLKQTNREEEWRWSRYTSLSHLGTCLRSDPEMSKAVLSMISGEILSTSSAVDSSNTSSRNNIPPFRYQRITPFKLAMGISMASSVPRMRQAALECVRDLIVEEETMRIRCGLNREGKRMGFGKPWMLCLVRSLEMVSRGKGTSLEEFQLERESGNVGHMLRCLVLVARFAESSEHGGGTGFGSVSEGCASSILQSLISLGFLLVECVKKSEVLRNNDAGAANLLASTLDISILNSGLSGSNEAETSANHATASIGRVLLCYLFYQSAAASSHFMVSSLSSSSRTSSPGGSPLCRSILKSSIDKFSGMAPNALEYATLLTDLLQFSPATLKSFIKNLDTNCDGLDDRRKEEVIALMMATHHIPMLIDTLSNVPGGGMHPHVASQAIIPAIGHLLVLQASSGSMRPGLAGYLWKKSDIIDHVNHAFLLAKKSLFCIDEEKRKCAAKMLISLIKVAVIASSAGNNRAVSSKWNPILDEMKGCLRRCLTQHQQSVRIEAYSSLVSLLPSDAAASNNTQTQDTTSPTSASGGAAPSPAISRSRHDSHQLIPPVSRDSLAEIVCSILLSQIERCITTPPENIEDRKARHQRATAIGSYLSQTVEEAHSENKSLGNSMPLRFEMIVSMRSPQNDSKPKGKSKKSIPIAHTLLSEALGRINEPLGYLIASCNCACSCAALSNKDSDDTYNLKHQLELIDSIKSLRRRMAGCNDIEEYLKWIKSNKQIFEITNNSRRKEEMAISKIATLITVAVAAESLLSTCKLHNENEEEFLEGNATNEEVENLFNLRQDAVSRASGILSSFVNSKPERAKKLKERDVHAKESNLSKKKKSERSKDDDDEEMEKSEGGTTTTTEVNFLVQVKNRKLIEEAIISLTPALPQDFLASALRRFGAPAESRTNPSTEDCDNDDVNSNEAIRKRLSRCMTFRRFVITKSLLLLGRINKIVKAGSPFSDLGANAMSVIASSLSLGPMLFAEFCSHCYQVERTSISPDVSTHELPLTQLSLRAFSLCVSGMASDARHSLTKAERVNAILTCAMRVASSVAPSSKESWAHYRDLNIDDSVPLNAPEKERALMKTLLAFVSSNSSRMCLFKELLSQSMNGEATECAHFILFAASAFADPNLREQCGVMLLKCYDYHDEEQAGVLGLDHGEANDTDTCLSLVVDVGFKLSNELDGDTHVPLPPHFLGLNSLSNDEHLRIIRSKVGLSTTTVENWPSKHHDRLREEMIASKMCVVGIVQQITWALTATLTIGNRFLDTFGRDARTSKHLYLPSIKVISRTPQSNFDREKSNICRHVSVCIEDGLDCADYVTFKLIPNMSENVLDLTQRFVACFLHSISKVICASAPSAEFVDVNGIFAASLLKSAKRLYSNLAKFILSYTSNPQCMVCEETKMLLYFTTTTLRPRIAALLLTLQEKHETVEGKYLAESKIESHGRIASLLVFEKEKLDNAFLKVVTILKQSGWEKESSWLAKHVVSSLDSDFVIKGIEQAKEREAPQTKKRKVKKELTEKKNKKAAKAIKRELDDGSDADDTSSENTDSNNDESDAVSCEVISMGNLTEDMGDDESEDDSGNDMDDVNDKELSNPNEDDSEEEAEFDD